MSGDLFFRIPEFLPCIPASEPGEILPGKDFFHSVKVAYLQQSDSVTQTVYLARLFDEAQNQKVGFS